MTGAERNKIKLMLNLHVIQRLLQRSRRLAAEQTLHVKFFIIFFNIVPAFAILTDVEGVKLLDGLVVNLLSRGPSVDNRID